jgi:tRNA/rRNA methyltransferase
VLNEMKFAVVLVEPLYQGNVGGVARSMMNFGIHRLIIVQPCILGEDARRRAKHGARLLDDAEIFQDFPSAIRDLDFCVATTGIRTEDARNHTRTHQTPEELCDILEAQKDRDITVGLVFGRENYGLYNEELALCHLVTSIPSSPEYPILNLSHAVTILCYQIYRRLLSNDLVAQESGEGERIIPAGGSVDQEAEERDPEFFLEGMVESFSRILELVNISARRKEITEVALRRVLGRALITEWEYHRLMGFFSLTERTLELNKK